MRCVIALLLLCGAGSCSHVNYCGAKICGHTNAHTFCQFPEGPSPKCIGYIEAPLTTEEKVRLIARLNRRRSEAANGRLRGLPPAGNMLKLRWVDELAREAQRWADQCRPSTSPEEQDLCRDLYSVTVGQCVASVVGEAPGLKVESMIDLWHMQAILYRGNVTSYIPPRSKAAYYGDFAQMLWAKTYMVGCGRSRFMAPWRGRLRSTERVVCNLAPRGPGAARALWEPGPPAAACPPGSLPDRVLTALCSYQPGSLNNIDIDNSMSLEEHVALNTVLEIESNESLNFHGSLDEMYLTKMTMLTMNNIMMSTEYSNNIQKRDIADIVLLEDAKADIYKIAYERDVQNDSPMANVSQVKNSAYLPKVRKRKVSLIGRPKTYNMEELNDVKHENVHKDVVENTPRSERDFYTDYEFKEADDENDTTAEAMTVVTSTENMNNIREMETNTTKQELTSLLEVTTVRIEVENNTNLQIYNESKPIENSEDYPNDSETVRELQEALEGMEQTLAPRSPEGQGKVRRDLRDISEDINSDTGYQQTIPTKELRNRTNDRGTMMNMVLKYMPYLKDYEGGILGSGGAAVKPCAILVLTLFLF